MAAALQIYSKFMTVFTYRVDPKFLDREIWACSIDPDRRAV